MAANVMQLYGSKVFNEHVMKERLPSATYKSLQATLHRGAPLDIEVANVVASVMKRWAMEQGATHFTHWFQPLTGATSEKHDSFVSPVGDGTAIMEFSGKELVRGEPDASSFPSGGLRATAEARGYTAWDPTSYAFVKDDVLCIPTAFCSYTGEALDKKTPLLRSMKALSDQAKRILKLFGKEVDYVSTTVGPEQEYFLIRKEDYEKRQDLILTGRTLFGAPAAKGQELEEHYFGTIRPRVSAFMKELDDVLWELGVPAKTKHNEVAPCQHELAPIFDTINVAIDHNLLTMEMMQKLAPKYGLVCLLHEKPFEGVNGSGKHNNWSMSTSQENLLDPGDTPMENLQFLVFLAAVIKAVDEYADLLRTSVATPGNDHRLGANEAPPAIISIFVGEELEAVIDAIASDSPYAGPVKMKMDLGVDVLPQFSKDTTDRNRTSPFAFTGNKFEFRMPGSHENLSDANTILNTAVAKALKGYADELEASDDFPDSVIALVKRTIRDHRRVIFNGDGYSRAWEEEAARRGLPNNKYTPAALPALIAPKNIALMEEFGVMTRTEMHSRYEVEMEHYAKILNIEALTMVEIARRQLLPAANTYMEQLARTIAAKKAVSEALPAQAETAALQRLSRDADAMAAALDALEAAARAARDTADVTARANAFHDAVLPQMAALRAAADDAETVCGAACWPLPSYSSMLHYVIE
ncbi:MAG TPA: glutamine synthetase III [Candidatus Gemmiger excrementipullorum]|uniref:Glutamine synthetase III n=1 Tax=Candidatus Gemmiger excrementipullorum TaxID=2838610 RepID=A0A9D1XZP8_9FIRM|nr:glutamine synthetase III [Candidatus Gemmiger excrementipullorum]